MSEESKKKVVKYQFKRKYKHRKYSYVNVLDIILNKYFDVYQNLTSHREGGISDEMYDKINGLLVEDYNNSINNLEDLSKKSMKYMNKKDKRERSKIFWYKFRRFFGAKKNQEIEELIQRREEYRSEMAKLFENLVSAGVRESIEVTSEITPQNFEEEPTFVESPKDLFSGPDEKRSLHGEVIEQKELIDNQRESLPYSGD